MNTEEVQEELDKRIPSPLNDIVNYSVPATCWLSTLTLQGVKLENLKETFGAEVRAGLLMH